MSRLGSKIASELLQVGRRYNVKRRSGEATVEVLELLQDGVHVEIKQGGFDVAGEKFRKGMSVTVPYDSDFYEPTI